MKKAVIVLILLFILPVQSVNAARKWADTILLDISNIPDNAAYVDVLVDIQDSSHYTEFDSSYMKGYDFDTKELAEYDKDGFVSFSCHYKDKLIKTDLHIKEGKTEFVGKTITNQFFWDKNKLKIVILDKSGHILQVSDTVKIYEDKIYLAGDIKYNVGENTVEPDLFDNRSGFFQGTVTNWPLYIAVHVTLAGLVITLIVLIVKRHIQGGNQADKSPSNRVAKKILSVCILIGILAIAASIAAFLFFPL